MKSTFSILFFLSVAFFGFYACEEVNNPEDEQNAAGVNTIAAKINGKDTVLAISRVILTDYPAENNKPAHQQLTLITMGSRPGFSIDFILMILREIWRLIKIIPLVELQVEQHLQLFISEVMRMNMVIPV